MIGLVVPDIANPFFVGFARAIETSALRDGIRVILCNSDEDPTREAQYLELLEEERVSGIILAPTQAGGVPDLSIPLVLADRVEGSPQVDSVVLDDAGAASALVDALQAAGCTRILGLFGARGSTAVKRRQRYTDALRRHGLPVHAVDVPHDTEGRTTAVQAALAGAAFDAIIVGDAFAMLEAAVVLHDRIDTQRFAVHLAGFDGATWLRLLDVKPLVIAQPVDAMAQAAMALLAE